MAKQIEPQSFMQVVKYVVFALIAIWLIVWMLKLSGINIL
jgi:hypothetical protein